MQARHGIFIEQRLRHLLKLGAIDVRVVAPVPWFPLASPRFGHYSLFARVPKNERRNDIMVYHPRYPVIPKIGMNLAPLLLASAVYPFIKKMIHSQYDCDLIDAHYFYPDGVAAVLMGLLLNKPVVITGRGSDLNQIARYWLPAKMIRWAASRASGLITVCESLRDVLVDLDVPGKGISVLRNGVDLSLFRPAVDRDNLRRKLGLSGPVLLSVGNLIPLKGHDLIITAVKELPGIRLLIAGDGPERDNLKRLARSLGVDDRVELLGTLTHTQLAEYYCAADIFLLTSSREGMANVLLESMACGTPVIASPVGGAPEIITEPAAGVLLKERNAKEIVMSINKLLSSKPDRKATRNYAEGFSWDSTSKGQLELFNQILSKMTTHQ